MRRFLATIVSYLPVRLKYVLWANHTVPTRYRHLFRETYRARPKTILEIGVYSAIRAKQMIEIASLFRPASEISYYGFDLFEQLDEELLKKEFSKMPPTQQEIRSILEPTGAHVELHAGFSQQTLPPFVQQWKAAGKTVDFVFIDGGHAEETIASDWANVEQLMGPDTVVIFDDYYGEDYSAHLGRVGCQYLIDSLDRSRYDVEVLPNEDVFQKDWGTLKIRFAKVSKKKA